MDLPNSVEDEVFYFLIVYNQLCIALSNNTFSRKFTHDLNLGGYSAGLRFFQCFARGPGAYKFFLQKTRSPINAGLYKFIVTYIFSILLYYFKVPPIFVYL